jgi:hypothetical protein
MPDPSMAVVDKSLIWIAEEQGISADPHRDPTFRCCWASERRKCSATHEKTILLGHDKVRVWTAWASMGHTHTIISLAPVATTSSTLA